MDAYQALSNLRQKLYLEGVDPQQVDVLCDQASAEMNAAIAGAVRAALLEAEAAGIDKKSLPFLMELTAKDMGNHFKVTTDSGKSDFSEPPFPMLNKLLGSGKAPKISKKDGKEYKVIPIMKTVNLRSSDDYLRNRAEKVQSMKDTFNSNVASENRSPDPTSSAKDYVDSFNQGRPTKAKKTADNPRTLEGFRTVTNLQNASTQWVKPGKEANFTMVLADINSQLSSTIEDIVSTTIKKYGG